MTRAVGCTVVEYQLQNLDKKSHPDKILCRDFIPLLSWYSRNMQPTWLGQLWFAQELATNDVCCAQKFEYLAVFNIAQCGYSNVTQMRHKVAN